VRLPELKTEVYGLSYDRQEIREPLYEGIVAEKSDYFKVLLAHGGDADHIPITKTALQSSGFDYIALGHIHRPQALIEGLAMYAGALEPIDCNDLGPHGYIIGEVHRRKVKLSFVEVCSREYRQEEIAVTEEDTVYSIREKIALAVREGGAQHTYRFTLTGQRHPRLRPDIREYLKCGRILEITDRTVPAFHTEELRRQYAGQLIGDYIESFGDGPQNLIEEKALRYGLEALLYPEN
jgi:DNA repair exonuclease SbcCD nuclease subunit